MTPRPPSSTLFPYTTLFRSSDVQWQRSWPPSAPASSSTGATNEPCTRRSRPSRRSEEHTSELQSQFHLVCRLLLEKKKDNSLLPHKCVRHEMRTSVWGSSAV